VTSFQSNLFGNNGNLLNYLQGLSPPSVFEVPAFPLSLRLAIGWFDVNTLDKLTNSEHDDEKSLLILRAAVDALVQAETDAGIPKNEIVVGGFSQGGAIAMLYGLTSGRKLGGVVALSTWVALNHKIESVSILYLIFSPRALLGSEVFQVWMEPTGSGH
jgi:predicted esterase